MLDEGGAAQSKSRNRSFKVGSQVQKAASFRFERTIQNVPSFADYYDMGKEVMPSTHRYMKAGMRSLALAVQREVKGSTAMKSPLLGELCSSKVGQARGVELVARDPSAYAIRPFWLLQVQHAMRPQSETNLLVVGDEPF